MSRDDRIEKIKKKLHALQQWRWALLHPRNWHAWVLFGLVWALGRLPMPAFVWTGKKIGYLMMLALKKPRRIVSQNLKICFPELSPQAIQSLVRKNLEYAGLALIEPGLAWFAGTKRLRRISRIEGIELLQTLNKKGQAFLLCTPHMLCFEAAGTCLARHLPFNVLYNPPKNPVHDYISRRKRRGTAALGGFMISRRNFRDFLYLLRHGQPGVIFPDHQVGHKRSAHVTFFGQKITTTPMISSYAQKAGALVFIGESYLDDKNYQYVVRISKAPLDNFPTPDKEADTLRINQIMEKHIRKHPDQYLWMTHLFKTLVKQNSTETQSRASDGHG